MQSHDESARSDIVGEPGEADEDDGGHVVDDLLLEVLQERRRLQGTLFCSPAPTVPSYPPHFSSPCPTAPSRVPRNPSRGYSLQLHAGF